MFYSLEFKMLHLNVPFTFKYQHVCTKVNLNIRTQKRYKSSIVDFEFKLTKLKIII